LGAPASDGFGACSRGVLTVHGGCAGVRGGGCTRSCWYGWRAGSTGGGAGRGRTICRGGGGGAAGSGCCGSAGSWGLIGGGCRAVSGAVVAGFRRGGLGEGRSDGQRHAESQDGCERFHLHSDLLLCCALGGQPQASAVP